MGDRAKKYKRDESLYNQCQENEVFVFLKYMPKMVYHAVQNKTLWTGNGRPPKQLYDVLVCLLIQHYVNFSDRRAIGIIRLFAKFAKLGVDIPCFKTLNTYRNRPEIKKYLDILIEETSKPLNRIEMDFSTDATGVSTSCFSTWYSLRVGRKIRHRDHISAHVSTSAKLNAAVGVDIDCESGNDSVYMREHVDEVRRNFEIRNWAGDAKYLSRKNCDCVRNAGGSPWFQIKKNTTKTPRGSPAWKRMVLDFKKFPGYSNFHYHKRSNSESTFSAKKRKFGSSVRCREPTAKENEEHLKWISYNFTVLSRAYYMYDIRPG